MKRSRYIPVMMGALMAPMMLIMLHDDLMSGDGTGLSFKLAGFVLAHLAVIAGLALLAGRILLSRRLHIPSLRHMAMMLVGMLLSAGCIHLVIHGGML